MRLAVRGHRLAAHPGAVAHIAAAVVGAVGVDGLRVVAGPRHADAVALPRHRGEARHAEDQARRITGEAAKGDHALIGIRAVHPAKGRGIAVQLVQRALGAVDAVEIGDEPPDAFVVGTALEEVPVEAPVVTPLRGLRDLPAHEEELAARIRPHEPEEQPEIGELLPGVAGHLAEQRALAVDHLVVRERQHEVLRPRVEHPERQLVLVEAPVDRVVAEIVQDVVHPAHVPLQPEAEAPQVHRTRDLGPGGGLLGHHHHVGVLRIDDLVQALDERDGFQVFPAAVGVGKPLAGLPRVVEIEHGRDRVHAEPVEVVALEPEEGVADEEVGDLGAPKVEDARAPVRVLAQARVGMLVEVRPVEVDEAVRILGKVGGHPVEEDADAPLVQVIDERHEIGRLAVTAGRRVVADGLVAPRAVEGMLHHRAGARRG